MWARNVLVWVLVGLVIIHTLILIAEWSGKGYSKTLTTKWKDLLTYPLSLLFSPKIPLPKIPVPIQFLILMTVWPVVLPFIPWNIYRFLKAKRKLDRPADEKAVQFRVERLLELREKRVRISNGIHVEEIERTKLDTEIAALESELEPEKKPAYRSIRNGS